MDLRTWLRGLGLEQYETLFRENDIDAEILGDLTDRDLEKIGVSLGHRKRLLKAVATLAGPPPAPAAASTPVPPASPQDAAERRQLTVMFSDLVGSTSLSAGLDPEDMRHVIRAYQDTVSGVVARYDGFIAKFMGDGVLAYFGFPRAHEDDAARAVHAGLEIAEVVAALQTRVRQKLSVRVGIATGLLVVGDLVGRGPAQETGGRRRHAKSRRPVAGPRGGWRRRAGDFDAAPNRRSVAVEESGPPRGEGPRGAGRGFRRARGVAKRKSLRGCAYHAARRLCWA
jgi:class 3 adenylate cyclase